MFKSDLIKEYVTGNRYTLIGISFTGLLHVCITFFIPVMVGEFYKLYFNADGSKGRLLEFLGIHLPSLYSFFFLFAGLLFVKFVLSLAEQRMTLQQGELFVKMTREKLFEAQISQDAETFQSKEYGYYLLRYSNDLSAVRNLLTKGLLGSFKNAGFLIMGFLLLGSLHLTLTLCLIVLFFLFLTALYFVARHQKRFIQQSRDKRSGLLAYVAKSFSRHSRVKEKKNELFTISRFNTRSDSLYEANMRSNDVESIRISLIGLLQYVIIAMILLLITVISHSLDHSNALVFLLVTLMLLTSIRSIFRLPGIINKGNISLMKIEEILKRENNNSLTVKEEPLAAPA